MIILTLFGFVNVGIAARTMPLVIIHLSIFGVRSLFEATSKYLYYYEHIFFQEDLFLGKNVDFTYSDSDPSRHTATET